MPDSQKATLQDTKLHNNRLVLRLIYNEGRISRAGIARRTRLTRPTVSNIVAELIEEGLVEEVGHRASGPGKPARLLSVIDNSRHLIGIDLADSAFRGCVVNLRGEVSHRASLQVDDADGKAALSLVYHLIDELMNCADCAPMGIGIGTPGLIEAHRGMVRQAVNLDWQDLPLRDLLERRYDVPVCIANDCQAAALGEYTFGGNKDLSNLIVLKVGRGIGAGIVINGQLHYGDGFGAGEIGHIVLVEGGEPCRCGLFGCLETVASSQALQRQARAIAQSNPMSLLHQFTINSDAISTSIALKAFQAGDRAVQQVVATMGHFLGIAAATLVAALNIEHILIAGSMARFGEPLIEAIRNSMRQHSLEVLADQTEVGLAKLGPDIVILGAAALLLAQELELN